MNSRLEKLPAELRRKILFDLDFAGLRALVRASAVFHQQYLLDRRRLLYRRLEWLGSVAPEACAVYWADMVGATRADAFAKPEAERRFCESWKAREWSADYSLSAEKLSEDEAASMVSFHESIVRPLVGEFSRWLLANLSKELARTPEAAQGQEEKEEEQEREHDPISATEEMRILRALYRFQLCCLLFGHASRAKFWDRGWASLGMVNVLSSLDPWEIEEVACVHKFAESKYSRIFDDIQDDVAPANPRFANQRRPPTPDGAFELDNSCKSRPRPLPV